MKEYEIIWEGHVREIYVVVAESEADARENWFDGSLVHSEAYDGEVTSVEEMED